MKTRVIPSLLLKNNGFVKTQRFKKPIYLGDPVNIVKIFNDKEADEIFILDITATVEKREPNFRLLFDIASECFMPLGYGGGITEIEQIRHLFSIGIEKISLNTSAALNPNIISESARLFGNQSIVVSVDIKKNFWGKHEVVIKSGRNSLKKDPVSYAREMQERGAGELFINSVDHDGMMQGYDLNVIRDIVNSVEIPVVACGGAGSKKDLIGLAQDTGISGVAAGSLFVFQGKHRAVLINMPTRQDLIQGGMP